MRAKIVTAVDAAKVIKDGDTVATSGFLGIGYAEDVTWHIEQRFLKDRKPEGITLVHAAGQYKIGHFAHKGLLKRVIAGFYGWSKEMQQLALLGEIEAYNLPQGVIINLYRDIAAGRDWHVSRVGYGTFVESHGGALNKLSSQYEHAILTDDCSPTLRYETFPINVAIIRATTADVSGNLTFEEEALTGEALSLAMAARNSGGIVIAQVKRFWNGRADPFKVKVPGIFVDYLVEGASTRHRQTAASNFNHAFMGQGAKTQYHSVPMEDSVKARIARRAADELREGDIVNIGIGLPEMVAKVARERGMDDKIAMTTEAGIIGGVPASGLDFGAAINMDAVIDSGYQFDFYSGGGLDVAVLGFAQIGSNGDVNVSKFNGKLPGCGGFIDISQNAKRIVFVGLEQANGVEKFVDKVEHVTFSAKDALRRGHDVRYVTDRAVYQLTESGLVQTIS